MLARLIWHKLSFDITRMSVQSAQAHFLFGLYSACASLARFCREQHVSFNGVVDRAVEVFMGQADVGKLRLSAKLEALLR